MCASVPDSVLLELVQTSRSNGGIATLDGHSLARFLQAVQGQSHPSPALPSGVSGEIEILPDDRFRFRGRPHSLSPDQWIVLDEIVSGHGEFSEIAARLWGDPTVQKRKLYKPLRSLRKKLQKLGLPFTVRSKNEAAFLLDVG